MLLSAVYVLVVAPLNSEVPEGCMNYTVYFFIGFQSKLTKVVEGIDSFAYLR
jgi:hypothetical protein